MSFQAEKPSAMSCADFEQAFDAYVDDMLDEDASAAARCHLSMCPACDREVTRWQQTRILLSTAVADFATAVDVSALRRDVEAALGFADEGEGERVQGGTREAAVERGRDARRRGGRSATREAASGRRSAFSAVWRFASAATVSAATAAAAVLLLTPAPQTLKTVATNTPAATSSPIATFGSAVASLPRPTFQPASYRGAKSGLEDARLAAYTPPPLAKPEISHVDGLEAAPGHLVSTWVQPRTNARVIWVQDRGVGAPIRTAGLDR